MKYLKPGIGGTKTLFWKHAIRSLNPWNEVFFNFHQHSGKPNKGTHAKRVEILYIDVVCDFIRGVNIVKIWCTFLPSFYNILQYLALWKMGLEWSF